MRNCHIFNHFMTKNVRRTSYFLAAVFVILTNGASREQYNKMFLARSVNISCGHTTDFYLVGKTDLPGKIQKNSPEVNSSRVLFYLGKKSWEGHTTVWYGFPRFSRTLNFLERKFKKARCAGISPIKETFFPFISLSLLTLIQRARWQAKT